jgi:hypothetical protein
VVADGCACNCTCVKIWNAVSDIFSTLMGGWLQPCMCGASIESPSFPACRLNSNNCTESYPASPWFFGC